MKKKTDRDIILISLLNAAFPFSYDVLKIFGKYFAVQDIINTETIKKPISNIYGGNRAMENGLYSVVPMLIEAGFFTRPKAGVYELKNKVNISSAITRQIYIESYKTNNNFDTIHEHQMREPYFMFIID